MLELENLSAVAGSFQLRDISLSIAEGECHAALGPSGSGKTTLLNVILGVLSPVRGVIRLAGVDITHWPIERRGMGYLPQQLGLFPHLTVCENITYSARTRGMRGAQFKALLDQLVSATELGALLERLPATLSGGERQRVALARALASQPRLVVLDEPFAMLNESLRRELWRLLKDLQQKQKLTVLMVTHDLAEAYYLADHITILLEGRIAQQGEKAAVYGKPAAREVARFLGVETLQSGAIVSVADGLATVEIGTVRLLAIAPETPASRALVSIRGENVILQSEDGEAGSVRNKLRARVVALHPGSPLWRVELDAGFPLFASITHPAAEELQLRVGGVVTALIKAPSVHLIPL